MKLEYVSTDVQELHFDKTIVKEGQMPLKTKTNYKVMYSSDGTSCVADFEATIFSDETENKLNIRYRSQSVFNIADAIIDDNLKLEIHVAIYEQLYPMWSEKIKSFAAMSGFGGILLPKKQIEKSEVNLI